MRYRYLSIFIDKLMRTRRRNAPSGRSMRRRSGPRRSCLVQKNGMTQQLDTLLAPHASIPPTHLVVLLFTCVLLVAICRVWVWSVVVLIHADEIQTDKSRRLPVSVQMIPSVQGHSTCRPCTVEGIPLLRWFWVLFWGNWWFDSTLMDGCVWGFLFPLPFPPLQNRCVVDKTRLWWQQHPKLKLFKASPSVLLGEERVWCYCGHSDHLPSRGTRPCVCGCCLVFFWTSVCCYRYLSIFVDISVQAAWNIDIYWWNIDILWYYR